jgi:hypothetical protein
MTLSISQPSRAAEVSRYITDLMVLPWDPVQMNCWVFTRKVVLELFGVDLPTSDVAPHKRHTKSLAFATHPERSNWTQTVAGMTEWAVALMHRRGQHPDFIEHAGVYLNLDGGGVLHMDDLHGVVFDSLFELPRIRTWAYPLLFVPKDIAPGVPALDAAPPRAPLL